MPCGCTYIIEVLCVLHDVWSPLILLQLHPALPEELSANHSGQVNSYFPILWDAQALQAPLHLHRMEIPGSLPPTLLEGDHMDVVESVMVVGGSP